MRDGPTLEQMRLMAAAALRTLPAPFDRLHEDLVLFVRDFADADQLAAVGLDDPWELTGLYDGAGTPDPGQWDSGAPPPAIWLFRRPLIAEWRDTGVEMAALVRHVVIHEAGHHLGLSDADMDALEDDADDPGVADW